MNTPVTRGQELTVTIEGLAFSGKSFARLDDFMIFIERGLPGQQVLVRVNKKRAHYAEARLLQILAASPLEIPPPCPHFGLNNCGGCLWQNLVYTSQLKYKQAQVQDCLQHIGGLENFNVQSIIPAPEIFYYRNKMEFSFGEKPWYPASVPIPEQRPPLALGLHVPGRFDRIIDIENCQLLSPVSNQILAFIRNFALDSGLEAWRTRDYLGFWRNIVFRQAKTTRELMVNLVTAALPEYYPVVQQLAQQLQINFNAITTIVHNICRKKAQVTTGDEEFILFGAGKIREQIGQFTFEISASSFFQTNTQQAEKLYQQILQMAEVSGAEVVYDFYCGTGTIAIYLSPYVREVIGFEIIPAAILDARLNCESNGVTNCRFIEGDLKDQIRDHLRTDPAFPSPDLIIIDPPRAGLHPKVIQQILELHPPKIIYVSCNPATLARDLKSLLEGESRYILRCVQPIDLFPHTAHCEAIALLARV